MIVSPSLKLPDLRDQEDHRGGIDSEVLLREVDLTIVAEGHQVDVLLSTMVQEEQDRSDADVIKLSNVQKLVSSNRSVINFVELLLCPGEFLKQFVFEEVLVAALPPKNGPLFHPVL